MEIDFLGLNSQKNSLEQGGSKNAFTDAANGGVQTFLSLSTSSSYDSFHREILSFSEKKTTWEFPACGKMIPSCSGSTLCSFSPYNNQEDSLKTEQPSLLLVAPPVFHHSSAAGFLYDLNSDAALANFRSMSELPTEPSTSLAMLYSGCPNVLNEPEKAENIMHISGDASTRLSRGYTPTVAMARRATLARFLEKRLHRMYQGRTSHFMGKLNATNSEARETTITKSNKRKTNNLKRSLISKGCNKL